jgi:hypothetical protein
LQLERFLGWRIHPDVDLLPPRQNDRHRFRIAASIYLLSIAAPADTRARFLELGYYQAFQQYSGRAMRESHEQLKITETQWAAFCKDFDDTMAKFGVPDAEKNELFAIVQSTRVTSL